MNVSGVAAGERRRIETALTDAGAALNREREENGQQGREQYCPTDAAAPGAQHGNQAFLDLILIDSLSWCASW